MHQLKAEEHLKVYPDRDTSVSRLQSRISARYEGITTRTTKKYVVVMLAE